MSRPLTEITPDIHCLITEDETPVDNLPSEKQQRLLTEPLYSSWAGPGAGRTFLAAAHVGIFAQARNQDTLQFPSLNLGLMLWDGTFENKHDTWWRWTDEHGGLMLTGVPNSPS